MPARTAPLQDGRTNGSYTCNPLNHPTDLFCFFFQVSSGCDADVTADIFTRDFVLQFDKRHFAPGCDPHSARPVRSVQFPVSCPGLNIIQVIMWIYIRLSICLIDKGCPNLHFIQDCITSHPQFDKKYTTYAVLAIFIYIMVILDE